MVALRAILGWMTERKRKIAAGGSVGAVGLLTMLGYVEAKQDKAMAAIEKAEVRQMSALQQMNESQVLLLKQIQKSVDKVDQRVWELQKGKRYDRSGRSEIGRTRDQGNG